MGCYDWCQCPGTNGCAYCAEPGPENLQVKAPSSEITFDVKAVPEPVKSITLNSPSVEQLIRRVGPRQCASNNSRLKITEEDNSLKLYQIFLKDYTIQDNLVALTVDSKGEK